MNNSNFKPKLIYKTREPSRHQIEITTGALDDCLKPDHKARIIWNCVKKMNTNPCFRHLKTLVCGPGRKATSPEVLLALWLLAFTDNVVSSRAIVELSEMHNAYRWLRGGVPLNHNMLCNFRSLDPSVFEDLLTSCLAMMESQNLLSDEDFAQDGTRVQAAAGKTTARREKTILEYKQKAQIRLKEQRENDGSKAIDVTRREKAAQLSAAEERLRRLDLAVEELEKAREVKRNSRRKKKEELEKDIENVRISLTDPECRKMKMNDGSFRLAYNVQVVTGTRSRAIYGVSVSNSSDQGKVSLMFARTLCMVRKIGAKSPKNWICDSGYSTKDDIEGCYELDPECNAVIASKPNKGSDPTKPKKNDGPGMKKWRESLKTTEFEETYAQRCSSVELSNARLKKDGLSRFHLIGLVKAQSEALFAAIAQNILICVSKAQKGQRVSVFT